MNDITKPSIRRLAQRGAVKSLSDDCYDVVRSLIAIKTEEVISAAMVVNSENGTKTLMMDDVIEAMRLLGYNVTESDDLEATTKN